MRKFSSYGPINTNLHYYAPRTELIARAYTQLLGEDLEEGGHYITVWAPRQTGKSWLMLQIAQQLKQCDEFDVAILTMQSAKEAKNDASVLDLFVRNLREWFDKDLPDIRKWQDLSTLFTPSYFRRPLILILDEFDALEGEFINKFANEFRNMYMQRHNEIGIPSRAKHCVLHGLALIGVRAVLGIENLSGSPFNVQRSLHIPNLRFDEVEAMFKWYERDSGQQVEQAVIKRLHAETDGQPGLTCWFGELLTEGFDAYAPPKDRPIAITDFDYVFMWATKGLPNSNILNLISKARQIPYSDVVLELFKTDQKMEFRYDEPLLNFLYMNGVIAIDHSQKELYARFASPFVQKRIFNYFANQLFRYTGKVREPFEDLSAILTPEGLNIKHLARRFEMYLQQNRDWLLQDAPRRKDLRIYEAVYHFCFYRYLSDFLDPEQAKVYPEFPTGNDKIDLIITYQDMLYGVELKSYSNEREYYEALEQAARYGKHLQLSEIALIAFVEYVNETARQKYEAAYLDKATNVTVTPIFVETGR